MANLSLQDQLLKAGLSDKNKAKKIKAEKRKQTKKQRQNKISAPDETQRLVQENKTRQLEKDNLLNQQRNKEAEKKQIAAQILQLIALNKLAKDNDGIAYNFTDQNKVKVIYISEEVRNHIISGRLAIVKSRTDYEVVAAEVAKKIKQRDEQLVIVLYTDSTDIAKDDGYQDYQIPDDLMW
ncbi:MAG: DUF2058 domain-containing protein [Methylococcales bacterium]|jgi:uncharacterized protein YaiL (DUF2058 family)|nr:DUF2058 domain-containing protein [Methylococcaceae bacterium]